jgi:hypothetical protein
VTQVARRSCCKRFFEYLQDDDNAARSFNAAMTSYSAQEIAAVTAAYDFKRFRTIADIGGGHGRLLGAMLRANRQASGILSICREAAR